MLATEIFEKNSVSSYSEATGLDSSWRFLDHVRKTSSLI